jgi:hypothetical protein
MGRRNRLTIPPAQGSAPGTFSLCPMINSLPLYHSEAPDDVLQTGSRSLS